MAYAPVYHAGEFPFFLLKSTSVNVLFIYCFYTFLTKGECKLSLNQQQGIYNNGKALTQIYQERVLDLHYHGFSQRQVLQDMRVTVGYVNKVVRFYEHSNSSLAAP